MARKPLRSQLNQIRTWVRQGRTDAWIAHQLEVPAAELREFRRRHGLQADEEGTGEVDLRDEIEAEIAAASEEDAEKEDDDQGGDGDGGDEAKPPGRRRRRRRGRRGRGSGRPGVGMVSTFEQDPEEGYAILLDPTLKDDPVYDQHWEGHTEVEVTVEPERIVIKRRAEQEEADGGDSDSSGG